MKGVTELKRKTLISGSTGSGKSTLLTAIAQTIMDDNLQASMMYFGASASGDKFARLKQGAARFQFMPATQFPFYTTACGNRSKIIHALECLDRHPAELLIVVDEPLALNKALALEFSSVVSGLSEKNKDKLNLIMTTAGAGDFTHLFGESFLCEFENHLILNNERQSFYEPLVIAGAVPPGAAIPIVRGEPQEAFVFAAGVPDTVRQCSAGAPRTGANDLLQLN